MLVRSLSERMHVTPSRHPWPTGDVATALTGLSVVVLDAGHDLMAAFDLCQKGVNQVLALGEWERPVRNLVMYTQASRPARDAALGIAGSLLRHMSVDSTLLVPADESSVYGARYRDLLDIRNAALQVYGVDVRTESFSGNIVDELRKRLLHPEATMLLVGVTSVASGSALITELAGLLAGGAFDAVLIACARSEAEPAVPLPGLHGNRIAGAP